MELYLEVIKNWNVLKEKSSKKRFQKFLGINILIQLLLGLISYFMFNSLIIPNIYSVLILVPAISLSVRRFHDIGVSGWWVLLFIIPYLGVGLTFFLALKNGKEEEN